MLDNKNLFAMLALTAAMTANVSVADEQQMTERIERLERVINGQGLMSLLGRVEALQSEVQRLNGDNELLRHELATLRQRQRQLYLDLDERLQAQAKQAKTPSVALVLDEIAVDELEINAVPTENTLENAAVTHNTATIDNGEEDYDRALKTLHGGQYEQAIDMFNLFIDDYPRSRYLPNAYYWQGEANYVLRDFKLAISSFQSVIERFPNSNKVADALLKRGFSQYELDQVAEAKTTLTNVMESYPDTSAARLAKVRLDLIKQEAR